MPFEINQKFKKGSAKFECHQEIQHFTEKSGLWVVVVRAPDSNCGPPPSSEPPFGQSGLHTWAQAGGLMEFAT